MAAKRKPPAGGLSKAQLSAMSKARKGVALKASHKKNISSGLKRFHDHKIGIPHHKDPVKRAKARARAKAR